MSIVVNLDVMLARRKMRSRELAERVGITEQNISLLKSGKVRGVRFDTLEAICAVLSVIVTWHNGPGKREVDASLSSDDYMVLLLGVALLAISSVMVEAARIAEDNEGFV